ncbi:MAG: RHS repeat-associated core domain-containing protein, partial [Acidobacteria bacterium]|nr:RHS repeat-associated core domain-containing protein [Acidobacteriota bacterium]
EYVYGASGLLATVDDPGTAGQAVQYATPDHLGTPRAISDENGAVSRHDYKPFGEELTETENRTAALGYGTVDGVRQKFTSKERDSETGLDNFGARYYRSGQGRFVSCDPKPVTVECFLNPQRWNLFGYVNNNPLVAIDLDGADGKGKGGDKVISVFLKFAADQRNYETDRVTGQRTYEDGPGWQGLGGNGYSVTPFGSNDVTGIPGPPRYAGASTFEAALKNSEVVVYVGHGVGSTVDGVFRQGAINIDASYYTTDGVKDISRTEGSDLDPKPEASAKVICSFTCDASSKTGAYFTYTGVGQVVVVVNSGKDGETNVGTLEKAAHAFVRAYIASEGDVNKAAAAASAEIAAAGKKHERDRGDTVEVKPVKSN